MGAVIVRKRFEGDWAFGLEGKKDGEKGSEGVLFAGVSK
jgi:hypothetical protein